MNSRKQNSDAADSSDVSQLSAQQRRQIEHIVQTEPGLKARQIAKRLGIDKTYVNQVLYANREMYIKDENDCWSLAKSELKLAIPEGWVTADHFEKLLKGQVIYVLPRCVSFQIPEQSKLRFDCIALVLTFANQLASQDVPVSLTFEGGYGASLGYLDRAGFFQHLHPSVVVRPARPAESAADRYRGHSENLVEIAELDVRTESTDVAERLKDAFVQHTGTEYSIAATNLFGELIGNVGEHSEAPHAFAGLQKYTKYPPHIQAIVSDRGLGIVRTLRSTLRQNHPEVHRRLGLESPETNIQLVREALENGRLSRLAEEGRGLGLFKSHDASKRFTASFSLRQEVFCLHYRYDNGRLVLKRTDQDLYPLRGTHICFDYRLG